jgi:hypothetical protein
MSIEESFAKYQDVWNDCYLGYILLNNPSGKTGQVVIQECLSQNTMLDFYPWLNDKEALTFPSSGLNKVSIQEFEDLFLHMAVEAIRYGSEHEVSNADLKRLFASFQEEFVNPVFFSNFTRSGWRPVTNHSRDSFLCAVGENKIGMWLSCDDE